jgi:predicted Na+-dependent transporter
MKKYNKIFISLVLYVIAIAWFSYSQTWFYYYPWLVDGLNIILLLIGISLSTKSVNSKETAWGGRISIIIGLILLLLSIIALGLELSPL